MGLDSVEIVLGLEESFGIDLPNEATVSMRTPRHMVEHIIGHVPLERGDGCRFQRSFFRVRRSLRRQLPTLGSAVERDTRLKDIVPKDKAPALWASIRHDVGTPDWPVKIPWPHFFRPGPRTVGELAWYVALYPAGQTSFAAPWTREKIGLQVRRIIYELMGKLDYSLDASLVKDLGVT